MLAVAVGNLYSIRLNETIGRRTLPIVFYLPSVARPDTYNTAAAVLYSLWQIAQNVENRIVSAKRVIPKHIYIYMYAYCRQVRFRNHHHRAFFCIERV